MKLPIFNGPINAYTEKGKSSKARFLRDAGRFLRRVGYELGKHEVYGEFRRPSDDVGVFVEVGTSIATSKFAHKEDRVVIRSLWRCRARKDRGLPKPKYRSLYVRCFRSLDPSSQ